MTVKEFVEGYNNCDTEQKKKNYLKKIKIENYIPFLTKMTLVNNIIRSTQWVKNGNDKRLKINSPAQYLLYIMMLIKNYTDIEVDYKNSYNEYDLLKSNGLLETVIDLIPEVERAEMDTLLRMEMDDLLQNETTFAAVVNNGLEKIDELLGVFSPITEKFANMSDEDKAELADNIFIFRK